MSKKDEKTSYTRMGVTGVFLFVALYIAVSFKGTMERDPLESAFDSGLVHNGDGKSEALLPLLDSIQKQLAELERNDEAIAKTLALLQEKWNDDKQMQGKLVRPGGSSIDSSSKMTEAPTAGLRKPIQSDPKRADGSCSSWTKLKMISCSREGSHIPGYFMPYVAEHLGLTYEINHMGKDERADKTMYDDVYSNPNPGCTLFVFAMPRSDSACYTRNKEFFDKAFSLRTQSKTDVDNSASSPIKMPYSDTWKEDIYWNSKANLVPLNHERPLIVYTTGEVFSSHNAKPKMDITLYRAQNPIAKTITAHFLQGVSLQYRNQADSSTQHYNPASLAIDQTVKNEAYYRTVMESKKGFAAIINGAVVKRGHHFIDATVRFALASLLDDYKPVHGLGRTSYLKKTSIIKSCSGMDVDTSVCMKPFKFIISMENSRFTGYISEKIFDAKLSESVPVYFGANNVDEYLNMDSIVFCNVSESGIDALRQYDDRGGKYGKILNELGDKTSARASDEQLVTFTKQKLGKELQPCIDEIKRLDGDDDAYLKKLQAPFYKDNKYVRSVVDGYVLAKGVADVVRMLAGMTEAR